MIGNLIVNVILAGVLFATYMWTPWSSLVLASLSSIAFSYSLFFDKEYVDEISPALSDKISVILGAGISYLGIVVSTVALLQ